MVEPDTLGKLLGRILDLRIMSCEMPYTCNLEGTYCDTGAYKIEKMKKSASWVWEESADTSFQYDSVTETRSRSPELPGNSSDGNFFLL